MITLHFSKHNKIEMHKVRKITSNQKKDVHKATCGGIFRTKC